MIFVGVDLGTSALKCGAGDRDGRRRAFAVSERFAFGELQDAEIWRRELERTLARVCAELDGQAITAIGVGGHAPSPVFCDAEMRPLVPVPTWRSGRAQGEFERLCALEPRLRAPSDARLEARLAAHGIVLLRERPQLADEIELLLTSWEFLLAHLTGVCATTTASTDIDIAGLAGLSNWRPSLRRGPGERLGMCGDTPVVVGGLDSRLASIGSGIREVGQACINGGSTAIVSQLAPPDSGGRFELGGLDLISEPVRLGGDLLEGLLGEHSPKQRHALLGEAASLDGSWRDEHGLATATRNALERTLLAQRSALDSIAARVGPARSVRMVGGLAGDARLHDLIRTILARPIDFPTETQASALGAAMQAAVGVGAFASLTDAAKSMTSISPR